MIPKILACAAAGATTLLASGIALGRWSQTVVPQSAPISLCRAAAAPTTAGHSTALAVFEDSLAAPENGDGESRFEHCGKAIDALGSDSLPAAWRAAERLSSKPFRIQIRMALLKHWTALDPAAAAEAATALADDDERSFALSTVATAWLQKDFRTAAAWCARQPGLTLNTWELGRLFTQPDAQTPASALATAEALPAGTMRESLCSLAFRCLSQTDPAAALAYAKRQPAGVARESLLVEALSALARKDPAATRAQLDELPPEKRLIVIAAVATAAAACDPLEALPYLDQLPTGQLRMRAANSIVQAMLAEDPEVAVDFALTFPAGEMQRRLLATATNGFVRQNPAAALEWLDALPEGATKHLILQNAWWSIACDDQLDPQTVARFVLALPTDLPRANALGSVVERMAHANNATAAAWVQQLADSDLRESGLRALAGAWAPTDTAGAVVFAQRLPEVERVAFLLTLGQRQARAGVDDIATQTALLPAGAARDAFVRGAVGELQRTEPRLAANLVDAMNAGPEKLQAATGLLQSWSGENPVAAADWLRNRPGLAASAATCSAVTREWAQWDAESAAQWVANLPAGEGRTAAVETLVEKTTTTSPALAATWAAQLADPAQRSRKLATIATTWLRTDRVAASVWLARADLPPETVQALLAGRPVTGDDGEELVLLSPFVVDGYNWK